MRRLRCRLHEWQSPGLQNTIRREHLLGYATIAAFAVIPAMMLEAWGLPAFNGSYPFVTFSLVLLLAIWLLRPLQLVVTRHDAPTRQLFVDLKANWLWIITSVFVALALPQTLDTATSLKKHIPDLNPYYADAELMRLDAVFGVEPWQITHLFLGEGTTHVIDALYTLWQFIQIALLIWLVLARNRRFQIRAALSFQIAWLFMGGIMAVAFASVGPVFVKELLGSDHYAPLLATLPDGLFAQDERRYLLATQGKDFIGGGISAMPSLHVAIAVLAALCIRDRFPKWQWLAWAYAAVIYIGSIHLGWHYASDGIVAAVCMVAIWKAAGLYMSWLERPPGVSATVEA